MQRGFQYISCYCLSTYCMFNRHFRGISIHLMLLFIYLFSYRTKFFVFISIHLMLLFICFSAIIHCFCLHFNTSHVTVYQESIILHDSSTGFQYISCYCLSNMIISYCYQNIYFNTSHVTVYHHVVSVVDGIY